MDSNSGIRMRARSRSVDGVSVPVPNTPLRNPDEPNVGSSPRPNGSTEGLQLIGQELVVQRTIHGQGTPARQVGRVPQRSDQLSYVEMTPAQHAVVSASTDLVDANGLLHHRESEGLAGRMESQMMSMPRGSPMSYGPTPSRERQPPLFDSEQLRRLNELQGQASWLYGHFGAGETPVPRPRFLPEAPLEGSAVRQQLMGEMNEIRNRIATLEVENEATRMMNQRLEKENRMLAEEKVKLQKKFEEAKEQWEAVQDFVTPDKGSAGSLRGSARGSNVGEVTESKEVVEDPYVPELYEASVSDEAFKYADVAEENFLFENVKISEEPYVPKNKEGNEQNRSGGCGAAPASSTEQATLQLMAKMMEGMTNLQRQILDGKDKEGDAETVRGQQELPALPEWTASSGPVDLSDWLVMIEPLLADMSSSSARWWKILTKEAGEWYCEHLKLPPIDRVSHDASPSEELNQAKWARLERRVSSMLLMAVPQTVREELVASKRMTALKILCQLMVQYQPGGLAEKELILRQLESPMECATIPEALQGLRKWFRWRHRATDLSVQEPDPFLLLKGLNRITKKVLETHKDLSFRVSLARSTLQVDSTPTSRSISMFGRHLIAEFEQVAHQDNNSSGVRKQPNNAAANADKLKALKAKKLEEDNTKNKEEEHNTKDLKCRFFLTKEGCKRGKSCTYSHDLKDEVRRCFVCGCPDHLASTCPRKKGDGGYQRSPPKAARVEATEEGGNGEGQSGQEASSSQSDKGGTSTSVQGLLEEATKVLKSISTATPGLKKEVTSQNPQRDEMMKNLQQQLDQLRESAPTMKVMRLSRLVKNDSGGLLDSGATHPLRPRREDEDEAQLTRVEVILADGAKKQLYMTPSGTMLSNCREVEPIVPMGLLTTVLECNVKWEGQQVQVEHPVRGSLKVAFTNGCPTVSRRLALELIEEIENKRNGGWMKEINFNEEEEWLRSLVWSHPVLSRLPNHIKEKLVGKVGRWNDLPVNKRQRKRFEKHGVLVHLFAGPDEGMTLRKAMQEQGGPIERLLEVDILRGSDHDFLSEEVYGGLLRACFEGKLEALVGGPNCRTRSVLRHFPIEGQTNYPRPVRSWKDHQEYGLHELTESERLKVHDDDVLMWRMITLFIVATYVRRAFGITKGVGFAMEQPASARDQVPDCVSIWDQEDWKDIKKEFNLEELNLNQGDYGGLVKKPTTIANNIEIQPGRTWKKGSMRNPPMDSKQLSRWAPGLMNMVAEALKRWSEGESGALKALSWKEHVNHHHIPFRKDCVVCQATQQRQLPHRRGLHPRCGVLSLDTTGPFHLADDLEGKGKYILVGALTWMVPVHSPLRDDSQHPPELPDEAFQINLDTKEDDMEQENIFDENAEGSPPLKNGDGVGEADEKGISSGALGNVEDATRDSGLSEPTSLREEGEAEEDGEKEEFEVRVYRMALPMSSKSSLEVTRTAMELMLRAKADGFYIGHVHTDQGLEFLGHFHKWLVARGVLHTRTPGDDPRANGRAEVSVQNVKALLRRTLYQAGAGSEMWPLALRHVNEVLRNQRIASTKEFPRFLETVHTRKRTWKNHQFEAVMEKAKYLFPAWSDHGHWVLREGESKPSVTRYVMRKLQQPPEEEHWVALELEVADAFKIRRRIRGKTAIRELQCEGNQEGLNQSNSYEVARAMKVVQEEMGHLIHDDFETVVEELKVLGEIKKLAMEPQVSDEVLQTRIISPKEVRENWEEWINPSKAEIASLLEEKAALRPVTEKELAKIKETCESQGKTVELVPSKIVFTKKPAPPPLGFKNKVRWVVCGNYESKKEGEENYSGGADAAAFRCLVHQASQHQWCGASIDIKTAFLNAEVHHSESQDVVLVKPPAFFVEKNMMAKDVVFQPLRAVYGFRNSPRLWSQHRDDKFQKMEVEAIIESRKVKVRFAPLDSEPNLWKIQETTAEDRELRTLGLMMTYVDDIFTVGPKELVEAVIGKIQETWASTPPEWVGLKPLRFLGMEVSTFKDENQLEVWHISQRSYIQELVGNDPKLKVKVVPITRDQCAPSIPTEPPTMEAVRAAQKEVGELLWTVTRTRPDLMFTVAKMSALVTKDPARVLEISAQAKGYLKGTAMDGLNFKKSITGEKMLCAFSDASYAPDGECSHGCTIITYQGSTMMWKSGRQTVVSLSTAESELLEIIEALTAGESLFVMINELEDGILKVAWCDSQAAVSILSCEGGSWRTRHLRIRASFARDIVQRGEWALHHMGGLEMIADIGTKPLTSSRLRFLKGLMNLEEIKNNQVSEEDLSLVEELNTPKEGATMDLEKISTAVKVITLLAVLGTANGQGEEAKRSEEEDEGLFLFLCVYTIALIIVMTFGRMMVSFGWTLTSRVRKWWTKRIKSKQKEKEDSGIKRLDEGEKHTEVRRPRWLEELGASQQTAEEVNLEASSSAEGTAPLPVSSSTPVSSSSFEIFATRTGLVYHTDKRCQYLKRVHTGQVRESRFCSRCAEEKKEVPLRGDTIKIGDWGSPYHHVDGCISSRHLKKFNMCLVCKEKGVKNTPTKR